MIQTLVSVAHPFVLVLWGLLSLKRKTLPQLLQNIMIPKASVKQAMKNYTS